MKLSSPISFLGIVLFFTSCTKSPFPEFSQSPNELYYKLENIGDGEEYAKPGDYVTARIRMKAENDSVLFDTDRMGPEGAVTFILPKTFDYAKDYREGYLYLNEGDSAIFITDANAVYVKKNKKVLPPGMKSESLIKVETKVIKIRTQESHEAEMLELKKKLEQGEFEEKKMLDQYLGEKGITASPIANGMYYIKTSEGTGPAAESGRVALLNYKGYFLNGRCFDASFEAQPFEYIMGAEEQLIRGLVIGIRKMHEGEKAKFIIPSHLAFGSVGSSTGMVPPFTTLLYEVELLKVQ